MNKKIRKELREFFNADRIGYKNGILMITKFGVGITKMDLTGKEFGDFHILANNLEITQNNDEYKNAIKWCHNMEN